MAQSIRYLKTRDGVRLAWAALGLALALASGQFFGQILYGVSARDPLTFVAVVTLVALVSLLATLVPAIARHA
jgi:uncharacterized membrane protein YhaH (DUF805 family)